MSKRPELPPSYSKTLAVIGRFRSDRPDEGNGVFVFENGSSDADAPLSAADVFAVLKPELRLLDGGSLWVDDVAFSTLLMSPPNKQGMGGSMPVGPDSVLLDQPAGDGKRDRARAETGGKLITKLLSDLDIVARFSGSTFPRALLELADRYLHEEVNKHLDDKVSAPIDEIFRDDPVVTGRILDVLLAFDADVYAADNALRQALANFGVDTKDGAKVKAIAKCVRQLREQLVSGIPDESWDTVVGSGSDAGMPWVLDRSTAGPEFDVDLGKIDVQVGASLRDAYVLYRQSADAVHKLVRAPSLHSYIFMWLMSKYNGLVEGKPLHAARQAYESGVKGAGTNRIFGERPEDTEARRGRADEKIRKKIAEFADVRGFRGYAEQLVPDILDVVLIENRFTREDLNERLQKLFVELAGSTSGPVAAALAESRRHISAHRALYQELVNILNQPEEVAWSPDAIEKAIGKAGEPVHKVARAAALDAAGKAAKATPDGESTEARRERIRAATLDAFIEVLGPDAIEQFAKKYQQDPAIMGQVEELGQAYGAAALVSGWSAQVSEASAAATVPPATTGQEVSTKGKERLKQDAIAAMPPPPTARHPLPAGIAKRFQPGEKLSGDIVDARNKKVGGFEVDGGEGVGVTFTVVDAELDGVSLVSSGSGIPVRTSDNQPLSFEEIDPEHRTKAVLERARKSRTEVERKTEAIDNLETYAGKREELRKIYAKPELATMSDTQRSGFQRRMRTLLLGEFMAAAPDSESRLGRPTISETLKLLLDISESIGDLNNRDLAKPERDSRSGEALGPLKAGKGPAATLNLSAYFRLPNGEDSDVKGPDMIARAIVYHRNLTNSVQDASAYLRDLADLKGLADAAGPATRLIVINHTLTEYAKYATGAAGEALAKDIHAATLYLPTAARARNASWGKFGAQFAANYAKGDQDTGLSCPMVISAEADALPNCPFPVASLGVTRNLKLRARPPGQQPLTRETVRRAPPDQVYSTMQDGLVVDGAMVDLSMPAAMAAVAVTSNEGFLGKLSTDDPGYDFAQQFQEVTGLPYFAGETVLSLLRRLWMQPGNDCLAATAVARIATLAMMRDLTDADIRDLRAVLALAKLEQAPGKNQVKPEELKAARDAAYDLALFKDADDPDFSFLVNDGRGKAIDEPALVQMFPASSAAAKAVWLSVRANSLGESKPAAIPDHLRLLLSFLKL